MSEKRELVYLYRCLLTGNPESDDVFIHARHSEEAQKKAGEWAQQHGGGYCQCADVCEEDEDRWLHDFEEEMKKYFPNGEEDND